MALIKKIGEKDENRISSISGSRVDRRIPDRHLRNNNRNRHTNYTLAKSFNLAILRNRYLGYQNLLLRRVPFSVVFFVATPG